MRYNKSVEKVAYGQSDRGTVMADVKVNYKNILVPVDGSKEAEAALDRAIKVATEWCRHKSTHSTCY